MNNKILNHSWIPDRRDVIDGNYTVIDKCCREGCNVIRIRNRKVDNWSVKYRTHESSKMNVSFAPMCTGSSLRNISLKKEQPLLTPESV